MAEHTRTQELFVKKTARIAASYLRKMENLPNTPETMKPFFDILRNIHVNMSGVKYENQKTVGTFCAMVPNELIYAAEAIPVRLCSGSYTAYGIGDGYIPRDACPLVKAVIGMEKMGVSELYENCSLMVVPITCDCKKKTAANIGKFKRTETLRVPLTSYEDDDTELYLKELYRLIPILEEVTGNKITADALSDSINLMGKAHSEAARFIGLRNKQPALISGTHVMAVMNSHAYTHISEWTENLKSLNDELEIRLSENRFTDRANQPKILLTGSPITFPNIKIPLLIEEMGGRLTADETCIGERIFYDPAVVVEPSFDSMMRSLAYRSIKPCTCPVFAENSKRVYRLKQMIKCRNIQGVIYHVLRGCTVYDYEYKIIEEEIGKLNIPIIRVESDYNEEDIEQLRIRIEAFIEMIKLENYSERKHNYG